MLNRYGDVYDFVEVEPNILQITGTLKHWRFGGQEGEEGIDGNNLGFVDPSGGPFIAPGMKIKGRTIVRIFVIKDEIFFEVEPDAELS